METTEVEHFRGIKGIAYAGISSGTHFILTCNSIRELNTIRKALGHNGRLIKSELRKVVIISQKNMKLR